MRKEGKRFVHQVVVGNIGTVYSGESWEEAEQVVSRYERPALKTVTWLINGEIYQETEV